MWFTPQKVPGHLIEAFARLVEMSPSVPVGLVIAGDGELFAEAEKKVAATGLEEKVSLL
jgi:glycosyltransferase involved in cell wall biosynthesis